MDEIELKFLDIDVDDMRQKLSVVGAVKQHDGIIEDVRYEISQGTLLRIRSMDGKHYLTHKRRRDAADVMQAEEDETEITDPLAMQSILQHLGLTPTSTLRKHREHYTRGTVAFEIDTLESEAPYLEIEARSKEELAAACAELGLRPEDGVAKTMRELFPHKF